MHEMVKFQAGPQWVEVEVSSNIAPLRRGRWESLGVEWGVQGSEVER